MDQFGHSMTKIGPFWKEFEQQAVVTISPDTRGGTVYYTTDGTTPTARSTKYTGPFAIDQSTLVKAITVDSKGTSIGFQDEAFYAKVDKVVYPSWYQTLVSGKEVQPTKTPTVSSKVEVDGLVLVNIADEPDLIDASGGYNSGCFIDKNRYRKRKQLADRGDSGHYDYSGDRRRKNHRYKRPTKGFTTLCRSESIS